MWSPLSIFNLPEDFLTSFLGSQWTTLPYPTTPCTGQTIIITGSNCGLGLEAARHFVRLGAHKVILACRSIDKGFSAGQDIMSTNPGTTCGIEVWQVDLGSYESVRQFCKRAEELERIDAVVENAGIATPDYTELEGMESTVTVNVISTFLMALLLLPKLRRDSIKFNFTPRLTIVASDAHNQARFQERLSPSIFSALATPSYQQDRYNTSKLLEILLIRELAPLITTSSHPGSVILNTLTPGFCKSELLRNAEFPLNIISWFGKLILARTTEMGSRTLVAAALAGEESHGGYMVDCMVVEPSRWVRSEEGRRVQGRVVREFREYLEGVEGGIWANI